MTNLTLKHFLTSLFLALFLASQVSCEIPPEKADLICSDPNPANPCELNAVPGVPYTVMLDPGLDVYVKLDTKGLTDGTSIRFDSHYEATYDRKDLPPSDRRRFAEKYQMIYDISDINKGAQPKFVDIPKSMIDAQKDKNDVLSVQISNPSPFLNEMKLMVVVGAPSTTRSPIPFVVMAMILAAAVIVLIKWLSTRRGPIRVPISKDESEVTGEKKAMEQSLSTNPGSYNLEDLEGYTHSARKSSIEGAIKHE